MKNRLNRFFTSRSQDVSLQVFRHFHVLPRTSPCVFSPAPKPSEPSEVTTAERREVHLRPLSSSEPQASRTQSAWQWSSRTGPPRPRPRPGWGRTWRKARRQAVRRSDPCRRSPSGTGRSDLRVWSPRLSLKG